MGPEASIEHAVCRWAKEHGVTSVKLVAAGGANRGQADRMFMRSGRVCFIEFKAPGNRPTALQDKWLRDRRRDGFAAVWADDYEEAVKWLRYQLLRPENRTETDESG